MAKGSHKDPAQSNAESVADALREVRVEHAGEASATSEFERIEQQLQDTDLQNQDAANHPVDVNNPPGSGHQPSQAELRDWLESHSGSGSASGGSQAGATSGSGGSTSAAAGGLTGSPASDRMQSEQDLWNHLTHGSGDEGDTTPDPGSNPRDVLAGLENRFGSPFDRLVDSTTKDPGDDPNPYATKATDKSGVEDGALTDHPGGREKAADFLQKQGLNPSPTVTGDPKTPISDAAQNAKLEDDLASGRATRHTSSDGTVTSTKSADGTVVVEDKNSNTKTTLKPDGSTVTQDLTTGKVTGTTDAPSTKTPDMDHQYVLPKNFDPGQFDADGHVERARQAQHQHDPTNVDPTDQDPSVTAVAAGGPIRDAKTDLLTGPGHNPDLPDFDHGSGTLPNQGTIPTDPNHGHATDPGPLADTGPPQTSGPSERVHHNPTPSMQAGSGHAGTGSGSQSADPGDGHGGGTTATGEPVLTSPRIPHLEFPDQPPPPGKGSHVPASSHHAPSDSAVPDPHHVVPPPPAAGGTASHDPIGHHPIVPDPSGADLAHPVLPAPGGTATHDPIGHHPILADPAVPQPHHVEVPPPADGGETHLDPGSHHPIPEPENHHVDPHFPG